MTYSLPVGLLALTEQAYDSARAFHANLDLDFQVFSMRLALVLEKHEPDTDESQTLADVVQELHTQDLYLATACAQGSDRAWRVFNQRYAKLIFDTALFLCSDQGLADEVAGCIMGHLFLSDDSGLPRIHSYDGHGPLSSWLRAIVAHQVYNELALKHKRFLSLESISQLPDPRSLDRFEALQRSSRYGQMIRQSLTGLGSGLSEKERLFITLYYIEALAEKEIGALQQTTRANVNYHLRQARKKLYCEFTGNLKTAHHLSEAALQECIEELRANPDYLCRFFPEIATKEMME